MTSEQYKALTRLEFDKIAADFANNDSSIYELTGKDYPDILKEVRKEEFTRLLDAGCGNGAMLKRFAEEIPGKDYFGIDLSGKMIEMAKQDDSGIHFMQGDCERLPYPGNMFDVMICSMSFHLFPNADLFFAGVHRSLRPGGKMILRDRTISNPLLLWLFNHIGIPVLNHLFEKGKVKYYSEENVRQLCEDNHLVLESFEIKEGSRMHAVIRKEVTEEY